MPRFYLLKANPDVRSRVTKDMIPHNSLTRNTAAYIVNLIISVEQYFLQRAYFNNRSSSEGPYYGEDMVQDSSVGPAIRLFSGGLDIKKA